MKKILFVFISVLLLCYLVACNTQESIQTGDTVPSAFGETFEIFIYDGNSRVLTDDKAKVSVKVILEKENDINNKDDYTDDSFYQYTYALNASGVVDKKYAGKSVYLSLVYVSSGSLYLPSVSGKVNSDGSYSISGSFRSTAPVTEWTPRQFSIGN